ncbi:MAG TPA: hypothetical protein VJY35_05250, partial [Candidatus Eisenbacteria bacterium]|nr:hypothetical protein [Candidatus Eisenbacteria bacterium]
MSDLGRILIRIPNWLGDALMARPLLHAVRRAHPRADIRAVGPRPLLDLLREDAQLDGIDPWPPKGAGARAARAALASGLSSWRPDVALILPF